MLVTARAVGVVGGVLLAIGGVAALIAAAADTAVIGAWFTIGAAVVAFAGGVLARTHPGSAAILFGLAAGGAGLVAPGVIPAIGDNLIVFLGYLTAGALLVAAAVVAFTNRKRSDERDVRGAA
jgi:hypothetical protein